MCENERYLKFICHRTSYSKTTKQMRRAAAKLVCVRMFKLLHVDRVLALVGITQCPEPTRFHSRNLYCSDAHARE